MTARAQAFSIALVALAVLGASIWFALESVRTSRREEELVPRGLQTIAETSREPVELAAIAPSAAAQRETIEAPAVEELGHETHDLSPTPDRPGPGQALLKIAVVAEETGEPLAGVELWLWTEENGVELARSSQTDAARGLEGDHVVSDAAGRVELMVVARRAYGLAARARPGEADGTSAELRIEPLVEGEERHTKVSLPTAWTLAWHVRAVDGETGLPLAGAEVAVSYDAEQPIDALDAFARATTDGDGRASLRLPAWEWMIARVTASGYSWGGCRVSAESGSYETAALVELHRPAALTAVVLDASGAPASGIDVKLHAWSSQLMKDVHGLRDMAWTATTGANGSCELPGLPSRVELPVELRRGERVLWRPKAPQTEDVMLEPGEHRRIEWRLEPACVLSGTIRDQEGRPLPQVPLLLFELPPDSPASPPQREGALWSLPGLTDFAKRSWLARTTSDDEGRFSIVDVPSGILALGPDKEYVTWSEPSSGEPGLLGELPAVVRTIAVAPEERAKTVELVFDRGLRIRGRVLGPDGDPVGRTSVTADGVEVSLEGTRDLADREGRFDLGPLLAGRYRLRAQPPDAFLTESEPVEVSAGEDGVVLKLSWGGILRGRALDSDNGETPDAAFRLTWPGGRRSAVSAGESFHFQNLPPGIYDVTARIDDGRIGVLRGLTLGAQEMLDELVVPVAPGAKVEIRTRGAKDSLERLDVEWEGIVIKSWWGGEPRMNVTVPPGTIRVSWWARENGTERLVHEERRHLNAGEEASIEFVVPE